MPPVPLLEIIDAYGRARGRRQRWESLWQDCYAFALPERARIMGSPAAAQEQLYDGTAPDAVQQLASSMLAELTPPWSRWFALAPGFETDPAERGALAEALEPVTARLQAHFDRSNFAVEVHQAFLDLITVGTATLSFEEAPLGAPSAFRFQAVPHTQICLDGAANGEHIRHFRRLDLSAAGLKRRYPEAELPAAWFKDHDGGRSYTAIEAVLPARNAFDYIAFVDPGLSPDTPPDGIMLGAGRFACSPFISFRWLKAPGEVYGRSPVMTALPDIKTANKVVELVLKNASIAVTGIWQAEDDGVLNPANIKLVPGSIIPKAPGSAGLTPLEAPGRFDVSELVLDDLRRQIRHTLLVDRLGPVEGGAMTATEVLVRNREMTRLLGATYGRLQAELLRPLIARAVYVLSRRGEIADIRLDGRQVDLRFLSPLARAQARDDVENAMLWLEGVRALGPQASETIDARAAARWLGKALGVPDELIRDDDAMLPPAPEHA
ncbi:MAG: portal protein [Geminicoccaceae bacterium]